MDFSEKWGRDVEEAVNLALADLNLEIDQVEVIILEEPSKGFFGIGSKLAKVRVEKKKESKETEKTREIEKTREKEEVEKKGRKQEKKGESFQKRESKTKQRTNIRVKPENLHEVTESPALDFLKEITKRMDLELSIKAMANEECLYFDICGKDSGTIIGKRGQTLDSVQYLTSLVANKNTDKYMRVIVDAENYRQKREKTLEQLADRLGDKVCKTGRSVRLEPMNPYERKVIHSTLQRNASVTTRSEGEEPYRRVIIEKK